MKHEKLNTSLNIILDFAEKWSDGGWEESRIFKESKEILLRELDKLKGKVYEKDARKII